MVVYFFSGVVSTSPLKLELEFEPVLDQVTWYLAFTFVYTNKILFTGSKSKQDVLIETVK
jgi:hypothetical protein